MHQHQHEADAWLLTPVPSDRDERFVLCRSRGNSTNVRPFTEGLPLVLHMAGSDSGDERQLFLFEAKCRGAVAVASGRVLVANRTPRIPGHRCWDGDRGVRHQVLLVSVQPGEPS